MWKCPNCETLNNEDCCAICGEKRPREVEKKQAAPAPEATRATTVSRKPPKKEKRIWIAVLISVVITVAVVAGVVALMLSGQENQYNAVVGQAQALLDDREYEEAISKVDEIDNNFYFKRRAQALTVRAFANMELGNYYDAIDDYNDALDIEPNSESSSNLAVCYAKVGDRENAFDALEDADERQDIADFLEGELYYAEENFDSAVGCFYECIDNTDDENLKRKAYIEIARIYKDQRHERDSADAMYHQYLELQIEVMEEAVRVLKAEDDLTLTEMMGEAYYTNAQHELAINKFETLLSLGYERPYIYRNIAIAYQAQSDYDNAEETLLEMCEKYPDDYTGYMQLTWVYIYMQQDKPQDLRDYSKAQENYELAKEYADDPDDSEFAQLDATMDELERKGWL